MNQRIPGPGELYRTKENRLYQVFMMADHVKTGEHLVICQALDGAFEIAAVPLDDFTNEKPIFVKAGEAWSGGAGAEKAKQPALQISEKAKQPAVQATEKTKQPVAQATEKAKQLAARAPEKADIPARAVQPEPVGKIGSMFKKHETHESATEELSANPHLLKFLDADTYEDKYQVLIGIGDDVTNRLIDDIAVVMDIVIPEGDVHERFYQLKNIILTRQKYETSRLR